MLKKASIEQMADKLHHTRGIVLRTIKYGETSIITTIFTELFGIQSYLVNGVRVSGKKSSGSANLFQPAARLELVAYHNELKQLQRLKEYKWAGLYQHLYTDVRKNAVSLYLIEMLTKCLRQPEANPSLYYFAEDALQQLDMCSDAVAANFPLFFATHLPVFFGFRLSAPRGAAAGVQEIYADLQEGYFTTEPPGHPHYLQGKEAETLAELLRVQHPAELQELMLNQAFRRNMLAALEKFYALHIQDFGSLKTLPVLKAILS